jgi:hypothetical protein
MTDESPYVIVNTEALPGEDRFLADYDPDWLPPGVTLADTGGWCGMARWTDDPDEAMRFPTGRAAAEVWRMQSTIAPLRPDGFPNRPLTAFTVQIVRLEVLA